MGNKLMRFLSTIIFSLIPFLVLSEEIETQISADTISIKSGEILHAQGNVRIQHGNNVIQAEALEFNQKSNEVKIIKMRDFYDGNAIKLSADKASISADLSNGIINAAKLLIDDVIRIQSDEVRLHDGQISSAKGISRVTSCKE